MDKDIVTSRQKLRIDLLTELYKHYHNPNNKVYKSRMLKMDSQKVKEDNEKALAYNYLKDNGFITEHGVNGNSALLITVYGIDFLENLIVNK